MKKLFFVLAAVAASAFAVNAEVLDPQEALTRALGSQPARAMGIAPAQLQLRHTQMVASEPAVYVFSNGDGYCVVAADDDAPALLGYSDEVFDANNIPDGLQYWLAEYARQIQWGRENGAALAPALARPERASIQPICTTTWDQGAPYNNECPTYGNGAHCITGCVATAMAQVMKVHNWPDVGEGRKSYNCEFLKKMLTINFASITFDWDNMLDHYRGSSTEEQRTAVAMLMKACGYSVEMGYTNGACGAYSINVAKALPKYFKYDQGIQYILRDFYDLVDWENTIYAELQAGRAVYLAGSNKDAGHAFVCDGYSKDGYFHINWGWNGTSNGYFLLTGLDPSQQGLGGSAAGYNNWQEAIVNVKPRTEGEESPTYYWLGAYDFNFAKGTYNLGETAEITSYAYNYGIDRLKGAKWGLKLVPANGGDAILLTDGSDIELAFQYGGSGSVTIPADLAAGTYTVTPGWTDSEGTWHDTRVTVYASRSQTAVVADGKITFTPDDPAIVEFTEISHNNIFVNGRFLAKAKITNAGAGDFYKRVHPSVQKANGVEVLAGEALLIDVIGQETIDFEFVGYLNLLEGRSYDANEQYKFYFRDDSGRNLSAGEDVVVKPETETKVNVGITVQDADAVNAADMHFTVDFACEAGYFAETPELWLLSSTGDMLKGWRGSWIALEEGDTHQMKFNVSYDGLPIGRRSYARVRASGQWISDRVSFKVSEYNGITAVEAEEPVAVEYYTLQGVKMAQAPAAGTVCVKVSTTADGARTAETVLVK